MLVTTGRPYGLKLTGVALLCQIAHLLEEREDGEVAGEPSCFLILSNQQKHPKSCWHVTRIFLNCQRQFRKIEKDVIEH